MFVVTRIFTGLVGGLSILLALRFWLNTDVQAAKVGLGNLSLAGHATVRADLAGFFLVGGAISLYAAIKGNAAYLWPNLLLVGAAITGRALTLALNGSDATSYPPMVAEAVIIGLLLYCQRTWPKNV